MLQADMQAGLDTPGHVSEQQQEQLVSQQRHAGQCSPPRTECDTLARHVIVPLVCKSDSLISKGLCNTQ